MTPKTAQQRAQEALDVAERRVKKLEAKRVRLKQQRDALQVEYDQAVAKRDYAARHPDLPNNGIIALPEKPSEKQAKSFESSHKDKP